MRIAVIGADGFIGRNLCFRLREEGFADIVLVTRATHFHELSRSLEGVDLVFHLAGVNRPQDPREFITGNAEFTQKLCTVLAALPNPPTIVFSSSTQALIDTEYGRSKRRAEEAVIAYADRTGATAHVLRLPNVFGKWSRPNYNSVIATFCHNIARGLPIMINDPSAELRLVYVDDLVTHFLRFVKTPSDTKAILDPQPVYETSVGEVAGIIRSFAESRKTLVTPPVGLGLYRALYATYLSFLTPAAFSYQVPLMGDSRGSFVEVLKTGDSGQFSYFTAHPNVTRGEHYHHSKAEKFLVIQGVARFSFRNISTDETYDFVVSGGTATIVETVPGWAHSVTNIGQSELVVMLWASEIFDRSHPDTIATKVRP